MTRGAKQQKQSIRQANGSKPNVPSETVCHDRWRLQGRIAAALACAVQAPAGRCAPAALGLVLCSACGPELEELASSKGTFAYAGCANSWLVPSRNTLSAEKLSLTELVRTAKKGFLQGQQLR